MNNSRREGMRENERERERERERGRGWFGVHGDAGSWLAAELVASRSDASIKRKHLIKR